MKQLFEQQFAVDINVVLNDLDYLRCQSFDIVKFIEEFNHKVNLMPLPLDAGTERIVKERFVNGLPFHVKEHVLRNTNFPLYSLTDVQAEAKRQMSISSLLNKSKKPGTDENKDKNKFPDKPKGGN